MTAQKLADLDIMAVGGSNRRLWSTMEGAHIDNDNDQRAAEHAKEHSFDRMPAEIRNLIYTFTYGHHEAIPLPELRRPRSLQIPGMYTEGLPYFFANTPIVVQVRSNWCVRNQHLHTPKNSGYCETGTIELPAMLREEKGVPKNAIRFKMVEFDVKCCCCSEVKTIAAMGIEVFGKDETETKGRVEVCTDTKKLGREDVQGVVRDGLHKMLAKAVNLTKSIKSRQGFNGLMVEDIVELAMCFRDTSKNPLGQSEDHKEL